MVFSGVQGKYAAWLQEALLIGGGAILLFVCIHFGPALMWYAHRPQSASRTLSIGDKVDIPLSQNEDRTIVIAANMYGMFSRQNLSFHRHMLKELTKQHFLLIMVVPDAANATFYSSALDLPLKKIVVTDLRKLGLAGTPTILEINSHKQIVAMWQGLVPAGRQNIFIHVMQTSEHVLLHSHLQPSLDVYPGTKTAEEAIFADIPTEATRYRLSPKQVSGLKDGEPLDEILAIHYPNDNPRYIRTVDLESKLPAHILLDIQPSASFQRHHLLKSVSVPADVLSSRAPTFARVSKEILVNCSEVTTTTCDASTDALLKAGVAQVDTLDRGVKRSSCSYDSVP